MSEPKFNPNGEVMTLEHVLMSASMCVDYERKNFIAEAIKQTRCLPFVGEQDSIVLTAMVRAAAAASVLIASAHRDGVDISAVADAQMKDIEALIVKTFHAKPAT